MDRQDKVLYGALAFLLAAAVLLYILWEAIQ